MDAGARSSAPRVVRLRSQRSGRRSRRRSGPGVPRPAAGARRARPGRGLAVIASTGAGPAGGRRPSELESGRHASGAVLPFHGGANPAGNSAGWSGKGGALLTTRPHQVDRRQQVSGETGYDQQYGDSEREGEPLGRAASRRVQGDRKSTRLNSS